MLSFSPQHLAQMLSIQRIGCVITPAHCPLRGQRNPQIIAISGASCIVEIEKALQENRARPCTVCGRVRLWVTPGNIKKYVCKALVEVDRWMWLNKRMNCIAVALTSNG